MKLIIRPRQLSPWRLRCNICPGRLLSIDFFRFSWNTITALCDTMWAFAVWVWVWVNDSQKIPLSVLARNPHKELVCEISHETGRGRGKEGPRSDNRRRENREGNRTAGESRQLRGCVVPEARLANMRGWVSIPGDFLGISLEYILALAHRRTESYVKVSQISPFLRLELTQVRVCLFVFYPSILLVVYVVLCVSVRKCEIPLAGDERNH